MKILTNLNIAKNELQNAVIQNLSVAPEGAKEGQIYYNTSDHVLYQYKGASNGGWYAVGVQYTLPTASSDTLGGIRIGAGLSVTENGIVSVSAGGTADSVPWTGVLDKPFDKLNLLEMEVAGDGSNRELGIKKITQAKVDGLVDALASKISEVKRNGQVVQATSGSVDIQVPTNTNQLENGAGFIKSSEAPVQNVNGQTGNVTLGASDVGAVPTARTVNGKPLSGDISLTAADVEALPTTGGAMTGNISMGTNKISGLANGMDSGDAVNRGQLDAAIAGIGTVFDLKGSKPTVSQLPESGEIGDVWYIEDSHVGYIWITSTEYPQGYWEQLGPTIDLSGYLTKSGLLTGTGSATDNAMTQKAVTDALNTKVDTSTMTEQLELKADKTTVNDIPVVKVATGQIEPTSTTASVSYTGTLLGTFAKEASGELVVVDTQVTGNSVAFTSAQGPNTVITCSVVYM